MGAPRLTLPSSSTRGLGLDSKRLIAAVEAAVTYYRDQLAHADGPHAYLVGRGLGVLVEREWPWRVGYAPPGWSSLTRHLRGVGFGDDELIGAGLSTRTRAGVLIDLFRDRIVFPVRDLAGHAVAFWAAPALAPVMACRSTSTALRLRSMTRGGCCSGWRSSRSVLMRDGRLSWLKGPRMFSRCGCPTHGRADQARWPSRPAAPC